MEEKLSHLEPKGQRNVLLKWIACLMAILTTIVPAYGQIREWRAVRSSANPVNFSALAAASDGGAFLATWALDAGSNKVTTIGRYSSTGAVVWEYTLAPGQVVTSMATDGTADVYLAGPTNGGTSDWVQKREGGTGQVAWTHSHGLVDTNLVGGTVGRVSIAYQANQNFMIVLSGQDVDVLSPSDGSVDWSFRIPVSGFMQVDGAAARLMVHPIYDILVMLFESGEDPAEPFSEYRSAIFGRVDPGRFTVFGSDYYNQFQSIADYYHSAGAGSAMFGFGYWGQGEQHNYWSIYGPDGQLKWNQGSTQGEIPQTYFVGPDMLQFLGLPGSQTIHRRTLSGQDLWVVPGTPFGLACLDDTYGTRLGCVRTNLTTLDYATGRTLWTYSPPNTTPRALVSKSWVFFQAGSVGSTVVLDKVSQARLTLDSPIGSGAMGTIEVDYQAPSGGLLFTLQSNLASVSVPATAFIPENGTSVQFPITATGSAAGQVVSISASLGDGQLVSSSIVETAHTLTVQSTNPGFGVTLGTTADANGVGQGVTPFQRTYFKNTHVAVSVGNGILSGNKLFDHFEKDGTPLTGPLIMDANHTVNAVYVQGYYLSVLANVANVSMTVWTPDYLNRKDGMTSFNRLYKSGVTAKVTAPAQVGTTYFHHWEQNGSVIPGNAKTIQVSMNQAHSIRAIYLPAYSVTIQSANPAAGVPITVWTADKDGQKNGTTTFVRTYFGGTSASMTAPPTVGINRFFRWEVNGVPQPEGQKTLSVSVTGPVSVRATYYQCQQLSVTSSASVSAVPIGVSKSDNQGLKDGVTAFSRQYDRNTSVTLTAPANHGGKAFLKWVKDGVPLTFNSVTTAAMDANHTYQAVYQ